MMGFSWDCQESGAGKALAKSRPPKLDALFKQACELYVAERYAEAVPIAEQYLAVRVGRLWGPAPLYALGLGYLDVPYQSLTVSLCDAETALARAMEIFAPSRQAIDSELTSKLCWASSSFGFCYSMRARCGSRTP